MFGQASRRVWRVSVAAREVVGTQLTSPGDSRARLPKVAGHLVAPAMSALTCHPTPSPAQTTAMRQGRAFPFGAVVPRQRLGLNLKQGNVVDSPTFRKITRARLPTGEAGSSRQIQLAMTLSF